MALQNLVLKLDFIFRAMIPCKFSSDSQWPNTYIKKYTPEPKYEKLEKKQQISYAEKTQEQCLTSGP